MLLKQRALLVFVLILLSGLFLHVYIQNWPETHTPKGRAVIVHKDDSYYINVLRQSMDGAWKFTEPHTTRSTPGVTVYALYTIGGKFASLFHVDPILMYSVLRIMGGVVAAIATYMLIITILPKSLHVLGVLFAFLVETGPTLSDIATKPFTQWTASASSRVIVSHLFEAAHHRFGEAMGILLFLLFIRQKNSRSLLYLAIVIALTCFGTIASPSAMGMFVLSIYIPYTMWTLWETRDVRRILPMILSICCIVGMGIWMKYEFAKGPPWNVFNDVEGKWFSTKTILMQFGSSIVLYVPWIVLFFITLKRTPKSVPKYVPWLMTSWILIPALLICAKSYLPWIPFANWRVAWGTPTLPFAILATLGAGNLARLLSRYSWIKNGAIVLFFVFSGALSFQFANHLLELKKFDTSPFLFPNADVLKSFQFAHTLPIGTGLFTGPTYGEIIPAYANVKTFIGPPLSYRDWDERNWQSYDFFARKIPPNMVRDFLKTNNISYVYYGPEEQIYGNHAFPLYPELLTEIFSSKTVAIYRVNSAE